MKGLINGKHGQFGVAGVAGKTLPTGFSCESSLHGAVTFKKCADLVTKAIWAIFSWPSFSRRTISSEQRVTSTST